MKFVYVLGCMVSILFELFLGFADYVSCLIFGTFILVLEFFGLILGAICVNINV